MKSIRKSTTIASFLNDYYREAFAALKGRGRAPDFELVRSSYYYLYPAVQTIRLRRTELDSYCLIPEYADPTSFGTRTLMYDYREVFAALKGRGRAIPALNFNL